ncbi:hypothetical protein V5799_016695 [Amblyomma americanum]|uniref:Uncharacterized protein n=1 Tax=Amblyomma americanum TaxID=6943 RepID=A0AAQ4F4F0_AMBAM
MLGVLRGRTPLGASVGQNPAVVFYVATMFTLIVLVMHVWLRKHSEETAARLAAQQRLAKQPAAGPKHRNGSRLNETEDGEDATTPPTVDSVEDEFAFFAARLPPRSDASDASGAAAANDELTTGGGVLLRTAMDERDLSEETPWFMKWFRKKLAPNLAQRAIKTRKLPEKVR